MIRQIKKICSYAAVLAMTLIVGGAAFATDVAAKDSDGNIVIVIDPGHGGNDPGMLGVNGVQEDDANYAIAQAMMENLKQYSGVRVYLTRPEDTCVTQNGRAMLAASLNADFLISVHNNSGTETSAGAIVFTSVLPLYSTITADMGNYILNNLAEIGISNNGIQTRNSTEYAGEDFYTVMGEGMRAGVPTVLIEHCFMSNTADVLFISHEDGSLDYDKIALIGKADADAVVTYFNLQKNVIEIGSQDKLELEKGYSVKAETTSIGSVTWSSSSENTVAVDGDGNIKAVNSGNAVVTYTTSDGKTGSIDVTVRIPEQLTITGFIDPTFYKTAEKFSEIQLDTASAVIVYSDGSVMEVKPDILGSVDFNKPGIQDLAIRYGALEGLLRVVYQTEDYIPEVTSREPQTETTTAAETESESVSAETTEPVIHPEESDKAQEETTDFDIMMVVKMAAGIVIVIVLATVVFVLENRMSRRRRSRRGRRRHR